MSNQLKFTTNSFYISKRDFKIIIDDAKSFEKVETGGNLFGNFDNYGNPIVFKVVNPSSNCKRTATSFIIDKEFATTTSREKEDNGLFVIGNWHSHKGYGGPSHGDDMESNHFLEINKHKKKVVSFIIDIQGPNYDIFIECYENINNHIYKKHLNLTLISSKKLKKLAIKFLSTINLTQKITRQLEKLLNKECFILDRPTTKEFIIQIPLNLDKQERIIKEINSHSIKTVKEEIDLFIYLSIPSFIDFLSDKLQEKILIGIASKDYSTDILFCKFQFKHIFNPPILIDVIKRIIENSNRCIKMNLSQFLLKEIVVN
jgi:proteasome lid subunit RPN8/RPN11